MSKDTIDLKWKYVKKNGEITGDMSEIFKMPKKLGAGEFHWRYIVASHLY
jgi:hypothetical protein